MPDKGMGNKKPFAMLPSFRWGWAMLNTANDKEVQVCKCRGGYGNVTEKAKSVFASPTSVIRAQKLETAIRHPIKPIQ